MLVLTRRIGERVIIGDDIEVTVLDVKGDSVRIGIQAPRETRIQRAEIVAAVASENAAAAAATADPAALLGALARRRDPAAETSPAVASTDPVA
ncbi:carbon storage regulator CsrA [Microbacterium sp. zg.Y1090]|uniref:carbon storage regulator CsrA n=1 Tax=Microbacterium TaxID=33882 RepID=UPI00214C0245|nr:MULTISPECIES: carbon storage regulator CsrA [unclassified Microbacterium]MCR2813997.1 carbon storage regulator CsrA [Microbacterium sp. zg.Y1084]MCR2819271.1 carbon storage regulator CsrA [Microbacterium sp. zg.Y1090]MDL5487188.1 carbon storage regulator CsrA [Microbacterium sp. zg-Y1211]WIM28253.1 carbon storage regulator CsrA [Microbacterium sp. zg-Y1090]